MTPLALGVALGHTRYGAFAALGALPAGVVATFGRGRRRVTAVMLSTAGMAVGAFAGAAAAGHAWLLLVAAALFAYTAGLLGAFGTRIGVAALQWPVSLLLATSTPDTPRAALARAAFVFAGGAWQAALSLADGSSGDRESRRSAADFARHLRSTLATHLSVRSPYGRHALRLAAVAVVAQSVATAVGLPHAYWAALTAVIVLKTDHADTVRRGLDRVGGTLCGLALGVVLIELGRLGTVPLLLGATAALIVAYARFSTDYLTYTLFLTGFVAALLDLTGEDTPGTALARLLATLLGGTLALAASHLRPTTTSPTPAPH